MRQHYAGFISRHIHEQMLCWYQKFSGINELVLAQQDIKSLKEQLEITQRRLYNLVEKPLVEAHEDLLAQEQPII